MRLCEHCRVEIPATTRVDARYCSATCRRAAHRERHDPTPLSLMRRGVPESVEWQFPARKCEHCGTPLPHEMRRHARYCSARCRKGGAAARGREERERRDQIAIGMPIGAAGLIRRSCACCGAVMREGIRVDARYCSIECRRQTHLVEGELYPALSSTKNCTRLSRVLRRQQQRARSDTW